MKSLVCLQGYYFVFLQFMKGICLSSNNQVCLKVSCSNLFCFSYCRVVPEENEHPKAPQCLISTLRRSTEKSKQTHSKWDESIRLKPCMCKSLFRHNKKPIGLGHVKKKFQCVTHFTPCYVFLSPDFFVPRIMYFLSGGSVSGSTHWTKLD